MWAGDCSNPKGFWCGCITAQPRVCFPHPGASYVCVSGKPGVHDAWHLSWVSTDGPGQCTVQTCLAGLLWSSSHQTCRVCLRPRGTQPSELGPPGDSLCPVSRAQVLKPSMAAAPPPACGAAWPTLWSVWRDSEEQGPLGDRRSPLCWAHCVFVPRSAATAWPRGLFVTNPPLLKCCLPSLSHLGLLSPY